MKPGVAKNKYAVGPNKLAALLSAFVRRESPKQKGPANAVENMSREDGKGRCESCGKEFGYYLIHNGFNESAFAYCDRCGETCLLNFWHVPEDVNLEDQGIIGETVEPWLGPCTCGGSFMREASPRCPHCNSILSVAGLYCVVIENRVLHDCWKPIPQTVD